MSGTQCKAGPVAIPKPMDLTTISIRDLFNHVYTPTLESALGGHEVVGDDWMPVEHVSHLMKGDPGIIWLEYHGEANGFAPDSGPLDPHPSIASLGLTAWLFARGVEPETICGTDDEARNADSVRRTYKLMQEGEPVIRKPVLWCATERIYGVPDVIVHADWLKKQGIAVVQAAASDKPPYVPVIFWPEKLRDHSSVCREYPSLQTRIALYGYMIGRIHRVPLDGLVITPEESERMHVRTTPGERLKSDLARLRGQHVKIKCHGSELRPWQDYCVRVNRFRVVPKWKTAKACIETKGRPKECSGFSEDR